MPEMPEVQAHAERLTEDFAGDELRASGRSRSPRSRPSPRPPRRPPGTRSLDVGRRGKHLLLRFEPVTFVVHLMQGGRLKPDEKQAAKPRGGQARWTLRRRAGPAADRGRHRAQGRRVGGRRATPTARSRSTTSAPRPTPSTAPRSADCSAEHRMRLHGWLRDQHIVAGLGRRLANEICHRAKLSPFAVDRQARRRRRSTGCTPPSASASPSRWPTSGPGRTCRRRRTGPGAVHHREGEACPVCGDTVRAVEYRRYTVNYCPTCQTGGKVLADNTTSKFLEVARPPPRFLRGIWSLERPDPRRNRGRGGAGAGRVSPAGPGCRPGSPTRSGPTGRAAGARPSPRRGRRRP